MNSVIPLERSLINKYVEPLPDVSQDLSDKLKIGRTQPKNVFLGKYIQYIWVLIKFKYDFSTCASVFDIKITN